MLANLERHILSLNCFRTNVVTPLDFVLHLLYAFEESIFKSGGEDNVAGFVDLPVDQIANDTLYLLHYAMSQYDLSRKKYSSLAIAAICTVIQDVHFDLISTGGCDLQGLRDTFLVESCKLNGKFGGGDAVADLAEIHEILSLFKEPFRRQAVEMRQ